MQFVDYLNHFDLNVVIIEANQGAMVSMIKLFKCIFINNRTKRSFYDSLLIHFGLQFIAKVKLTLILVITVLSFKPSLAQTCNPCYAIVDGGDWDDPNSWSDTSGGAASTNVPGATEDVIIGEAGAMTILVQIASDADNLTINTGGTLQYSSNSITLTVNGNLTMDGNAAITTTNNTNNRVLTILGTYNIGAAAAASIGGIQVNVTGTTTLDGGLTLNHNVGVKTFQSLVTLNAGGSWTSTAVTTTGRLVFQNGITSDGTSFAAGDVTFDSNAQSIGGTTSMSFANDVNVTGITLTNDLASPDEFSVGLDLQGTGGFTQGTNAILNIGDDVTITTLTATASPNTVVYNGTAGANVACPATSTYHHLTIDKTVAVNINMSCATTINGDLTINGGTLRSDLNTGAFTHTVVGSTSISSGSSTGTYSIRDNSSVLNMQDLTMNGGIITGGNASSNMNVATTFNSTGASSTINGTNLTVTGATTIDGPIVFGNANGVKTFQSLVTVNAGSSWTSTTITNEARLIFQNGISNNGTSFSGGGVTLNTNPQSISGTTSVSFANDMTVTGITATNNLVSPDEVTIGIDLQGTGGFTQSVNSFLNIGDDATITTLTANASPNTVNYNTATGSTIACPTASTYHHLTIDKTAVVVSTLQCSLTINGDFTINGGTVRSDLNVSAFTHTVIGSTSFSSTSSTATYNIRFNSTVLNAQDFSMDGSTINGGDATGGVNVATTFNTSGATSTLQALNFDVTGASTLDGPLVLGNNTGVKTFQGLVDINASGSWTSDALTTADVLIFQSGITNNGSSFSAEDATFNTNDQTIDGGTTLTFNGDVLSTGFVVTNDATVEMTDTGTATLSGTGTWSQGTGTLDYAGATITVATFNTSASGNIVNYNRAGIQNIFNPSDGSYYNLATSVSGIKTVLATLDVDNDLTISGTANLDMNGFDLSIGGSYSNSGGTFTEDTQTVTFDGTGAQTIDNTSATETFYNVIIDKASGSVAMGGSLTTMTTQDFIMQTTNSGTFTGPATHNINGDALIGSGNGATWTAGANINLIGDWTNNDATADFDPSTNTVTFVGIGAQAINGTQASQTFYNVIIDNTGGSVATGGSTTTLDMQDFTMQTTNSGTFTGPATHNINGNVTIGSGNGATWTAGTTINALGDWTNNDATADFDANSNKVNFSGTGNTQTIGGTGSTSFYDLELNNTFGTSPEFTLGLATTIENELTMTSGDVDLATFSLTLGTTPGTGILSYTLGNLFNGSFIRYYNNVMVADGTDAGLFPMGDTEGNTRPFYITTPTAAPTSGGTITLSVTTNNTASDITAVDDAGTDIIRQHASSWDVTTGGGLSGGDDFNISGGGTGFGTIDDVADLRLMISGAVVGLDGGAGGSTSNPSVSREDLTLAELADSFHLGSVDNIDSPLPIELLYFHGKYGLGQVNIRWSTAIELNNDYFTLERSDDGEVYHELTTITGAGTSTQQYDYAYVDTNPFAGTSYYRLRQTDFDGHHETFEAVKVKSPLNESPTIYPNPSSGNNFNIKLNMDIDNEVVIHIYDGLGKSIGFTANKSGDHIEILPTQSLYAGVYFVNIQTGVEVYQQKLLIK